MTRPPQAIDHTKKPLLPARPLTALPAACFTVPNPCPRCPPTPFLRHIPAAATTTSSLWRLPGSHTRTLFRPS